MGRGQEAREVGGEARELPVAGEKGRASGPGGLAGLPVGVAGFPYFRPLNIGQSVTQAPQVVQDHLLWWLGGDREASSRISMSTSVEASDGGGGWWGWKL